MVSISKTQVVGIRLKKKAKTRLEKSPRYRRPSPVNGVRRRLQRLQHFCCYLTEKGAKKREEVEAIERSDLNAAESRYVKVNALILYVSFEE